MKACSKCREVKPLEAFSINNACKDKKQPQCKSCDQAYYWRTHERCLERAKHRRSRMTSEDIRRQNLAKYGISLEEYTRLYNELKGVCPICKLWFAKLHVDHDHQTSQFRGLICCNCNLAIGHAKESIDSLRRMISYLEQATLKFVN